MTEIIIDVNGQDWEALNHAILTLTEINNKKTGIRVYPDQDDKAINRLSLLKHKIYDELEDKE